MGKTKIVQRKTWCIDEEYNRFMRDLSSDKRRVRVIGNFEEIEKRLDKKEERYWNGGRK